MAVEPEQQQTGNVHRPGHPEASETLGGSPCAIVEEASFFALCPELLCVFDSQGRFKRVNAAALDILGFTPEELLGTSAFDYIHPDDRSTSQAALAQVLTGAPLRNFVNRFRRRDGSYRYISWATAPGSENFYAAGRDVTEEIKAKEAVSESHRFIQSTLDALLTQVAVLDDEGVIVAVNKAWREFAAANGGNLISCGVGANYLEACRRGQEADGDEAVLVEKGIRQVMDGEQATFSLEYPCHCDREQRWFVVSVTRFSGPGPTRVVVSHEDITERKLVEERLWKNEQQYRAIFQNSLDAIVIINDEGSFLDANPAACKIYEVTREQLLTLNVAAFTQPDWEGIEPFLEQGQREGEYEIVLLDGSKKRVEYAATANFLPGLHLTSLRDVTARHAAELAVRESEKRLRFISDNARVGIVLVDREFRYLFANAAYAEILNLPSPDITGLRVPDVLPGVFEDQIRPRLELAFTGVRVSYELRRPLSGEPRHYLVRYEPTAVDGKVAHVVVVITDISERKAMEEALRQSEARMAGIVNAAMDAIITIDESQCVVLFNPAAELMFGRTSNDIVGQPFECLIPERFRGNHREHVRRFGNTGQTSRKMGKLGDLSGLRANGEEFPIEASIAQLEIGGHKLFTVILRDITDRKRSDAALHQANVELECRVLERTKEFQHANELLRLEAIERRMAMSALRETAEAFHNTERMLKLVMNHIPQAIFWKDCNSVYLGCNERFRTDAGLGSAEDIVGKTDLEMPWSKFAAEYQIDDNQVIQEDRPKLNIEEQLIKANGETSWLRTNKVPLHDSQDNVMGVLCSYEEITAQKLAEAALLEARREAEAANLAKSEFLSRMSHELRTPLNAILGFGQILEMRNLTAKESRAVDQILRAGRHLLQLINEVLDITRIETGHISLSIEPVEVHSLVREALNLVQPLASQREISLLNEIDPRLAPPGGWHVLADRQRLSQVILNFLSNAIKYNREGGRVVLGLEEVETEAGKARIRLLVRDNGNGISAADQTKLFIPFERLGIEKTKIEGTGIGLALSKRLVEIMGGMVGLESEVGAGSTFWVEFPAVNAPSASHHELRRESDARPVSLLRVDRPVTVLYIEDNASNLSVMESLMEDMPQVRLLTAIQGSIGLELAAQHHPDVILLDLHLPDIHGDEILRQLRSYSATGDIPVIMISADATQNQIERLLAAGAEHYLTKPLDVKRLVTVMEDALTRDN